MKIKKETLLTILLVAFIIVSTVQAIQLNDLNVRVKSGSFSKGTTPASSSPIIGEQVQPPSSSSGMVGGC